MTYGYGPYYPDDMTGPMVCIAEGCAGPNCPRCGKVNYAWLGYLGYIGRMAKKWNVSKEAAEERIEAEARAKWETTACSVCFDPLHEGPCKELIAGYVCECKNGVPYPSATASGSPTANAPSARCQLPVAAQETERR